MSEGHARKTRGWFIGLAVFTALSVPACAGPTEDSTRASNSLSAVTPSDSEDAQGRDDSSEELASLPSEVASPTPGADADAGKALFESARCAACHAGGKNVIVPQKSLSKEALRAYRMDSITAIANIVTEGKNAMPAFQGRLSDSEIDALAAYVLSQSKSGW